MNKMYFRACGFLDYIEPEKAVEDNWKVINRRYGTDENLYDIVEKEDDIRYTKYDECHLD